MAPDPEGRDAAESRLVIPALVGVAVMTLCIVAIFDTDDVWIVLVTVVAIALVAIGIALDLWRILGRADEE
jgi:hypothetical protein